jgi:hypothetical protein
MIKMRTHSQSHYTTYLVVLALSMFIFGNIAHSASVNSTNSTNAIMQQPLQPSSSAVSGGAVQQQIVIQLSSNQAVRTQAKTNIVGIAIVIIGITGIIGGVSRTRRNTRPRTSRRTARKR